MQLYNFSANHASSEYINAFLEMIPEDAKYHLDRCIKSGLWCPGGDEDEDNEE